MRQPSELTRCLLAAAGAILSAACIVTASPAWAATEVEEVLATAQDLEIDGRLWQAEALLTGLAQAGHVAAMERLALLHWYGRRLYPSEPWSDEVAQLWFSRAAERGSEIGHHMLQQAARRVAQPRAGG